MGGDDGDLFLSVKQLVQLLIALGDRVQETQSLGFSQDLQEFDGQWVEGTQVVKNLIQLNNFSSTNTSVLSEKMEGLTFIVNFLEVHDIFINIKESSLLRGRSEKYCSISTFNSVFLHWWLMIWGALYNID